MRCGVLITTSAKSFTTAITLDNLKVHDVFLIRKVIPGLNGR